MPKEYFIQFLYFGGILARSAASYVKYATLQSVSVIAAAVMDQSHVAIIGECLW